MALTTRDAVPVNYTSGPTPDLKDTETPEALDGINLHVGGELKSIQTSLGHMSLIAPQVADREPSTPLRGMIRYSVSPWDPLGNASQGWVYYDGSIWTTYTVDVEADIAALQTTDTSHQSQIDSLSGSVTTLEGDVSANASAITTLETNVTDIDGRVTANATSITALETTVNDPATGVSANASAVDSLDTRVTTNEGDISAVASRTTTLETTVDDPATGVAANASGVSSLNTEVTRIDGDLSALSTSFTGVFASNATGDASAMFGLSAVAAPTGYDASIRMMAKVEGDTFGGDKAVMQLDVGNLIGSRIRLVADRLVMATGPGPTATIANFATFSGTKIRFATDVEIDGNLMVTGSIKTAGVEANAINEITSAFVGGPITSTTDTDWVDVQTITVTLDAGEKLVITFTGLIKYINNGSIDRPNGQWRLVRDGIVLRAIAFDDVPSSLYNSNDEYNVPFTWVLENSPGAGTHTYTAQVKKFIGGGANSGEFGCKYPSLIAHRVKR